MTTTSPSWLPSWPVTFRDIEDAYLRTVPRQYPGGLYKEGTDERRDLDSTAVVVSWVAQGGEWIKRRIFPQYDDDGLALPLWEECYAIARAATIAARQTAIITHCRLMLGTATKPVIQRIMAPIFGVDPADIDFSFATLASVNAFNESEDEGRAYVLSRIHIHTNGTAAPDRVRALDAIAKLKPAWIQITVGQYQQTKWGTQGGWGTSCW